KGEGQETWSYQYDAANHLVSATQTSDGTTVLLRITYLSDALGQLVGEKRWTPSGGTQVTHFGLDASGQLWVDTDGSGAVQALYGRPDGEDALAARVGGDGAVAWYLTDHQGTVRALTDGSGVVRDRISYDAFGLVTVELSPAYGGRLKYTGL